MAASVCAALFASCGVPVDDSARNSGQQPDGLELVMPTTSVVVEVAPTTTVPVVIAPLILYFIAGEGLITRVRILDEVIDPSTAVQALSSVPVDEGANSDVRTGLVGDVIGLVTTSNRNVVVELNEGFSTLAGNEQILVLGQITMTLTTNRLARGVIFTQRGEQIAVPDANGEPQSRAMVRDDYRVLLSR